MSICFRFLSKEEEKPVRFFYVFDTVHLKINKKNDTLTQKQIEFNKNTVQQNEIYCGQTTHIDNHIAKKKPHKKWFFLKKNSSFFPPPF